MQAKLLVVALSCQLLTACGSGGGGADASAPGLDAHAPGADAALPPGPDASPEPADAAAPGPDAGELADVGTHPDAGPTKLPLGAVCQKDLDCAGGVCASFGYGNDYCSKACASPSDCVFADGSQAGCATVHGKKSCVKTCENGAPCVDGVCARVSSGAHWCVDYQGKLCTTQADCAAGTFCEVVGFGMPEMATVCNDQPWGTILVGQTCDPTMVPYVYCDTAADCGPNMTCDSLQCNATPDQMCADFCTADGTCGGPCKQDSDCPASMLCEGWWTSPANMGTPNPEDDQVVFLSSCTTFAGTRTPCTTDAQCSDGERCSEWADPQLQLHKACEKPRPDFLADGTVAADYPANPAFCAANVVMEDYRWICAKLCQTGADCDASQQCLDTLIAMPNFVTKACLSEKSCQRDADCATTEACEAFFAPGGVRTQCVPAKGDLLPGQACDPGVPARAAFNCASDGDCTGAGWTCNLAVRTCRPPTSLLCKLGAGVPADAWLPIRPQGCLPDGLCSAACAADADCGAPAEWVCSGLPQSLDTKGTFDPRDDTYGLMKRCVHLPGSRAACAKNADCTTVGEVCRAYTKIDGTLAEVCGQTLPKAAGFGKACTLATPCDTGLCDFNDGDKDLTTGTCSTLCVSDGDCTGNTKCLPLELAFDGKTQVKACRVPSAGGWGG
jgi:hypothetical protein